MENFGMIALESAKAEILKTNEMSAHFGLVLSPEDADRLTKARAESLRESGRVEFGGGILPRLVETFCDSPYVDEENYAEMLQEMQELFYQFKTESADAYSDDEVLEFLEVNFHGIAQGSLEYLAGTSLEALARYARGGAREENQLVFEGEEEEWS